MAKNDQQEWVESVYISAIQDPEVRQMAWQMAHEMREEGDPKISPSDQVSAHKYLRKCLVTRSVNEVAALSWTDLAGLLARGTLGSARYRSGQLVATGRVRHGSTRAR